MSNGHATPSSNSPKSDQDVFVTMSEDSGYPSTELSDGSLRTKQPPKSPNNLLPVRAYLPNKQRTSVSCNNFLVLLYFVCFCFSQKQSESLREGFIRQILPAEFLKLTESRTGHSWCEVINLPSEQATCQIFPYYKKRKCPGQKKSSHSVMTGFY